MPITTITPFDIYDMFTYHPPQGDQLERYKKIRDAAHRFAMVVFEHSGESRERSIAIASIREATMWANAGIAMEETRKNES